MALLSVIRRWHFRQHIPIREIERCTGLSRNTIRKYLRADTVEPKFKVAVRPSKLDPFAEKLSAWLRIEASKSRKQRRTAKQMCADLVVLGYDGSYNRVAAFVRAWKADRQRDARRVGAGLSCRWCSSQVRHSSSTGARTGPGSVRIFVCGRAVEHQPAMALVKRSPKMTANWALAMVHSRGPIFHSFSERFKTR